VIGRPITRAVDPLAALETIVASFGTDREEGPDAGSDGGADASGTGPAVGQQ
jgi:hypothetical protein